MTTSELGATVKQLQAQLSGAVQVGAHPHAQQIADTLLSIDDEALKADDPAVIRDLLDAASALIATRDLARAGSLLAKGINAMAANPRASQVELIVPLNNLMVIYDQQGDRAQWSQIAGLIGAIAQTLTTPLTRQAAVALSQLGQIFERGQNVAFALVMFGPVRGFMLTTTEYESTDVVAWLMHYARLLLGASRYDDVVAVCRDALAVIQRPDANRGHAIEVFVTMSTAHARAGDEPAATDALERAVATADELSGDASFVRSSWASAAAVAYNNLAGKYIAQHVVDRYDRADELFERSIAIIRQHRGEGSADYAGAVAQRAVLAEARGDIDRADTLFVESIALYDRAPDTNPAELSDYLTDLGLMRLAHGRAADAVAPLERVVDLRGEGEPPLRRANALSNAALAHFRLGHYGAASRSYGRAVDLRFAK
jgi:tetratricopeptide (TPR) repeat protein